MISALNSSIRSCEAVRDGTPDTSTAGVAAVPGVGMSGFCVPGFCMAFVSIILTLSSAAEIGG